MTEIRFVTAMREPSSLDLRVPVKLIHVDEQGTATIEEESGRRSQWAAEKLLPPECYLCTGTEGAFQILAYGSAGRLRCVHAGPCPEPRANANPAQATPNAGGKTE